MGKFLKVVVVILLLVSAGAAALAYLNYEKRTMLVGRTDKLEKAIELLAATFNAEDPKTPDILPDFAARDVADVQAREVAVPDTSTFWDDYNSGLENPVGTKMNIHNRSVSGKDGMRIPQIKNYYRLVDGQRVKAYDGYETTGEGTMSQLLDEVQERASAQNRLLNSVGQELKKIREELEDTITELNQQKKLRRQDLVKIEDLKGQISRLEQEKSDLQASVTRLETDKAQLTDQLNTTRQELARKEEEYESLNKKHAELDKRYKEMVQGIGVDNDNSNAQAAGAVVAGKSTPGVKGTIVSANHEWHFVLIKLTPEAVAELTAAAPDGSAVTRSEEYHVRRPGLQSPAGDYVTRVRIQSIRRDGSNLAVAESQAAWENPDAPVAKGDEVFF